MCHSHSRLERYVWSHNTVPGEAGPRPCTAPGCKFAHDPSTAAAQQAALFKKEAELVADVTKTGKAAFAKWRIQGHAHQHYNVQPGKFGEPFLVHHFDRQILDPLHLAELGKPKTPWKHGILNNASDDAREAISEQLTKWKHGLDCRTKLMNRVGGNKWFTGEKWATFCAGKGGSPGGPVAIATLVLIIAKDLQSRGVDAGMETAEAAAEKVKGGKRSKNLANFASTSAASTSAAPAVPALKHKPTALELAADPAELKIIRDLYGSRAQTIINTLLSFDGYFRWYYPLKHIPFLAPMDVKLPRAIDNCRKAIDFHEICERLSIRHHGSFLLHGSVFKVSRDILEVGDVWATDLSKLELQNADTKRTAAQGGARNLTFREQTVRAAPQRKWTEGPAAIVKSAGYYTSMAVSVLRKLLGKRYLSQGDGIWSTPASRQKERLFGQSGTGRSSAKRALQSCAAQPSSEAEIDPKEDSCISAFVRLLAAEAAAAHLANQPA